MERLHNQENLTRKNPASTSQQTIIVNSDEEALATLQCKKWTHYCCSWISLKVYSKQTSDAQKQGKRYRNLQLLSRVCLTALQGHQTALTPERLQALGQEHIIVAQEPSDQVYSARNI